MAIETDPTTQSNYLDIYSEHVSLTWNIDWTKKIITGTATHDLIVVKDDVTEVIFDTQDLAFERVEINGQSVEFEVTAKHPVMGSALKVSVPKGLKAGNNLSVTATYATTEGCIAVQWLEKEQTKGNTFPYLFSQCQPIYARTLLPVQDTPSVKIKYTAHVTSVLPVLMSAIRQSPPSDGPAHDGKTVGKDAVTYVYHQPVPIPSYLIAIASGNVVYRAFEVPAGRNWTSGVWAEPETIDAAFWEFSEDTCRYLAKEEDIVIPYKFGVYDLLVLPPSFPYGGMENACLTFLTPTLLAGDRTLVDVVAHEATHSYFGNGVTHAHATHFWLNEGWTTYIERVLLHFIHSPADRDFSYIIGSTALNESLKLYEKQPKYQRLVITFEKGEDPDDAYSSIAYEKGANLILHLERTLGGLDVFLPYIRDYVSTFIGKSITTWQWKDHLYAYYAKNGGPEMVKKLDSVDWDAWFFGEGLSLPVEMKYDTTLATKAYDLASRWDAARTKEVADLDFSAKDIESFSSLQSTVFLERLAALDALPGDHIIQLGSLYGYSRTLNAELRSRFYRVALKAQSSASDKFAVHAVNWVSGSDTGAVVGRMKFCRDMFRMVYTLDHELAQTTFLRSKMGFHPIARRMIEKDIGLA
ncbi:Metalloprotease [Cylindrobasidium torrendii FP15055 ss-10]|uniref:Metalloprotease n=1 Tax=Cylindrobasidium torrendii FP15055 ss-10 TaxID=1314674 RepID=A0A0D7BTF5_9AGAR|nr:Metalloprotease [Cylindrobasidium torrendii FP15055 ss-10]